MHSATKRMEDKMSELVDKVEEMEYSTIEK